MSAEVTGMVGFGTGDEFGIEVEYEGGDKGYYGPWRVVHDADSRAIADQAEEVGHSIVEELARQKPRPVVSIRIVRRSEIPDGLAGDEPM